MVAEGVSGGFAAVYPVLVAADGAMMSETLYGLLIAAALYVSLRILEGERAPLVAASLGVAIIFTMLIGIYPDPFIAMARHAVILGF